MRGIIFDFDGLIVDTELPGYQAWAECHAAHGYELLLSDYTRCVGSDWAHYRSGLGTGASSAGRRLDWPESDRERTRPGLRITRAVETFAWSAGVACRRRGRKV